MAFSDGGSWLVAEDLHGSFVRINLSTLDMLPFAPAFGSQGSPGLLQSQVAVSPDGRFVAIANQAASSLKVYDLATCRDIGSNLEPAHCQNSDYQPFINEHISDFVTARHLRFLDEGLLSFEAELSDTQRHGTYELAPRASITALTDYLAAGDSYTSGEGAFDYLAGTDTAAGHCHSSVHAYPRLLALDLFSPSSGHSVACSGAVIADVGNTSPDYHGQNRGIPTWRQLQGQPGLLGSIMAGFWPGYVAQYRFVQAYQPDVVTVSIGGNDIGFGDILETCVAPHVSLGTGGNTCYNTYEDRLELRSLIDRTVPRWTSLLQSLQALDPAGRLYMIGYPDIVSADGSCAANVHLNLAERQFAGQLVAYLNGAMQQAAEAAGVRFIDISQALVGHRLCEAASYAVAVNGLTAGTDAGPFGLRVFGSESYHPNALGHQLIEQAILRQTNNFAGWRQQTSPINQASNLLQGPKTNRTVYSLVPDHALAPSLVAPGATIPLTIEGMSDGLRPYERYGVDLDRSQRLATVSTDQTGSITGQAALPATAAPGIHSLDVIGRNQAGQPVDVRQLVEITDFQTVAGPLSTSQIPAKNLSARTLHTLGTQPKQLQTLSPELPRAARHALGKPRPAILRWRTVALAGIGLWVLILLSLGAWRLLQ